MPTQSSPRLDHYFPRWDLREYHELAVDGPSDEVIRAVETLTWGEMPIFRVLIKVVSLGKASTPRDGIFFGKAVDAGQRLERTDNEVVFAWIARPGATQENRPPSAEPETFPGFDEPGHAKIGFNFRHADGVLSSETRVWSADEKTRRLFRVYWAVAARPFGGLCRHEWLHAVRRRMREAERRHAS
ncbi:hypothetical protein [Streptomyces apocyni]|uniref:hypothetical protein n=1 Tax=Streptomyces apocyni TaxID=2654677 RepID=UPI0012EA3E8C|nr:hypothetical protein [Streptomyces apocyni]